MMGTDDDKWASLAAELGLADQPPRDSAAEGPAPTKRGRGRPRRGSSRKRAEAEAAPPIVEEVMEDTVITEDMAVADGDGAVKKRRRRRSRKKKGTADGSMPSKGESAVAVLDDDDAADAPPADWRMPSWQELIDSLHRP